MADGVRGAFAVCHVRRLRGGGHINAAVRHNDRSNPPPNADPGAENEALRAYDDPASPWRAPTPWEAVQARIHAGEEARRASGKTVRKRLANAVHAFEVVLSASPEYFRPDDPGAWGEADPARLRAWRDASWDWLKRRYGDRLIDARLHLDEATPHIQAVVVPLTEDDRLSAKEVIGNAQKLAAMHTSYAAAVAHLGIERGIEGSKARHETIKRYYGALDQPDPEPPAVALPTPPLIGRESWAAEQAARLRGEVAAAVEAAARPAKLGRIAERQRRAAEGTARQARAELAELRRRFEDERRRHDRVCDDFNDRLDAAREALAAERKAHADRMRDLDLEAVLEAAGWDRDPADRRQWRGPEGAGRVSLDGAKWFDHDAGRGGGKAIDLAKHLTGEGFEGALAWLGRHFGAGPAQAALRAKAEELPPPPRPFEAPIHDPDKVPQVRAYLAEKRGLSARLIDSLVANGKLLAESYRGYVNAVFVMRDEAGNAVGAERRGTGGPFSGLAPGSSRNEGYFRVVKGAKGAPITAVVATEAAIDAISAHGLIPVPEGERWIFASTAGARPDAPWLRKLVQRGLRLLVGYDSDPAGEAASAPLLGFYGGVRLAPPAGKDWNDALRAARAGPEAAAGIERAIRDQLDAAEAEGPEERHDATP